MELAANKMPLFTFGKCVLHSYMQNIDKKSQNLEMD